ncbi:MAG: Rieske 2Fe-2S domain-containing protein [Candidatus Dormibacteria bacterium]
MGLRELIGKLEGLEALDGVSDRIAGFVNSAVRPAKSLLSGTWLEHPLHPLLSDLPIGCWSGAVILDLFGGSGAADAVDPLVELGALAAVPAVVSGLSDWADSYGPERRVGVVHAAANVTALGLFAASLMAGHRSARPLRLLGLAAVSAGGYLGGHLSFGRGVGVDHQAFLEKPSEWVGALETDSLEEATPTLAEAGGARVMLYRRGTQIYAISDVCPHAAGPLHEGSVDDELCVTCPWHGSRFRLSDGRAVHGPASAPAVVYQTRVEHGKVQVRAV